MQYRYLLVAGALFAIACEALFGKLSRPNDEYCSPGDGKCSEGYTCDIAQHRCVLLSDNADGGTGVDGGISPAAPREFFGAAPILLPNTGAANEQGVLYRGDFDGNSVPDIFIMGQTKHITVLNPATAPSVGPPVGYKFAGTAEMAAIGLLDDDKKDDIVIALSGASNSLEVMLSKDNRSIIITLDKSPRAVAIGDFNGDELNDIAIGYIDGKADIKYSRIGAVNDREIRFDTADGATISPTLVAMAVPPYRNTDKSQDLLVAIRSGNASTPHRLRTLRGAKVMNILFEGVDISDTPSEIVIGQFGTTKIYDAAVLVGDSGIDVFRNIKARVTTSEHVSFDSLRTEAAQPNKGKLAAGHLLPDSASRGVDDLAVLLADSQLAVYPGGSAWTNQPPRIAGRGLAADHIVVGAFSAGSTADGLAGYLDTTLGGTLAIARYQGSGSGALPSLAQQHVSLQSDGPNEGVLTGSFNSSSAREFALIGGGTNNLAIRCAASDASSYTCAAPVDLGGVATSATTVLCDDSRTRVLFGRGDGKVGLLDLAASTSGATMLSNSPLGAALQIAAADLNGDGNPDIVTRSGNFKISRSFGTGDCLFANAFVDITPNTAVVSHVALGDIDSNGKPDLITNEAGKIVIYINPGNGMFPTNGFTYATTGNLAGAVIGDFRGNGQREAALLLNPVGAGNSKIVWVALPENGTTLVEAFKADLPMRYEQMVAADANGDGRVDLALLCKLRRVVSYLSGAGPQQAVSGLSHYMVGRTPGSLAFGQVDFDGSSPLDLITVDKTGFLNGNSTSAWILQGLRPGQVLP